MNYCTLLACDAVGGVQGAWASAQWVVAVTLLLLGVVIFVVNIGHEE